jgi:hypothetical protein
VSELTPRPLLQVAQAAAHLFSLVRADFLSFSFPAARHCLAPFVARNLKFKMQNSKVKNF